MNFPEENTKEKKQNKFSNVIGFIFLLIIITEISSLTYIKSKNSDLKSTDIQEIITTKFNVRAQNTQKSKPTVIQCDEKEKYAFTSYKGMLIKCTSGNIKAIDKEGTEQWSIPISMSNPRIKQSNSDFIVYDLGARDIIQIAGRGVKWSKKFNNNIINANISESGYVSVVQELKGYKAAVTVFDLHGNEFFTRPYADNFVLKTLVSPLGKYVAIATMDISGIQATTNLEFRDLLGNSIATRVLMQGEVFPSLWFMNDETMVVVNETYVVCLDKASNFQKEKWILRNKEKAIYSSAVAGKYIFIAMSGDIKSGVSNGPSTEVKIFDIDGKQVAKFSLSEKVETIDTYNDVAALNTGRVVYFINTQGNLLGKYSSKVDIRKILFLNKKEIAVVSKGNVILTKLDQ